MKDSTRRNVTILEEEIVAICREAGLAFVHFDELLRELERGGASARRFSAPVAEALRNMLLLRRELLARDDGPP